MRAEHPHTEFTTTSVVPLAFCKSRIHFFGRAQLLHAESGEVLAHRGDEALVVHLLGKTHDSERLR